MIPATISIFIGVICLVITICSALRIALAPLPKNMKYQFKQHLTVKELAVIEGGIKNLEEVTFAFEREVVETGPDEALVVDIPLLVGRVVRLVDPHDHLGPGRRLASLDVQRLPVHLTHDHKRTPAQR